MTLYYGGSCPKHTTVTIKPGMSKIKLIMFPFLQIDHFLFKRDLLIKSKSGFVMEEIMRLKTFSNFKKE